MRARRCRGANNNYLGLSGVYLLYDHKYPGHENFSPGSLRLPGIYGVTDIPLFVHNMRFCPAANGRNEAFLVIGSGAPNGDKWIVNGKIHPKLTVRRRKYRFRIINTRPVKIWNLRLIGPESSPQPEQQGRYSSPRRPRPIVTLERVGSPRPLSEHA